MAMNTNLCKRQLLFLIFIGSAAFGQTFEGRKESGIYLTEKDYVNNVITFLATTDDRNTLAEKLSTVVVVRDGLKQIYRFGTIYGYYKDGFKYRAFGSTTKLFGSYGYYKVVDDSGLIIYSKPSSSRRSNGYLFYYYSNTASSQIKVISKKNVVTDFKDRPRFVQLVSKSLRKRGYTQRVNGRLLINEIYLSESSLN
jgi:hypothetical protein